MIEDLRNIGCQHEELQFGSGDFYIFCKKCWRNWVLKSLEGNNAEPANMSPNFTSNTWPVILKRQ